MFEQQLWVGCCCKRRKEVQKQLTGCEEAAEAFDPPLQSCFHHRREAKYVATINVDFALESLQQECHDVGVT